MTPRLDCICYDIEIEKCIPDARGAREPDLEYCAGWEDHLGMGIACLCAFDLRTRLPRVFLADNLGEFATLIEGRTVVGFNNLSFDDRLLAANGITVGASYDLLAELRVACGEPPVFTPKVTKGGRKLEDVAKANLDAQKTLTGALAPVEWQRGRRGVVIDYNLRDVMLLVGLVKRLPSLIDPVTRQTVTLAMPGFPPAEARSSGQPSAKSSAPILSPPTPAIAKPTRPSTAPGAVSMGGDDRY